jgi:signal transduction histidine kinase
MQEALADCVEESDRVLTMLKTMMDVAEAEAGVMNLSREQVNVGQLLDEVVELYEYVAEEVGVTVHQSATSDMALAFIDPARMRQVFANLLDNAIKYTPEGGHIELSVDKGPVITIADSGPGVPSGDEERVLERFVRLDETRSTPGNGLGLSLVSAVAKLHGARLNLADNRPGLRVSLDFSGKANRPKESRHGQGKAGVRRQAIEARPRQGGQTMTPGRTA